MDWKASKQPTVMTSTTEAKLLGLSEAGKQLQWWKRLLERVGMNLDHKIRIACDNMRTVNLVNSSDVAFETKLRHVDIHCMWIRQEVQQERIIVNWVPTDRMVADGLTKILPRQRHEQFIKLLRMVEIRDLVIS